VTLFIIYIKEGDKMAKNKNNNFKNSSKNSTRNKSKNQARNSTQNTHAEVPDNTPGRSGPGGN
jgi:hypothetical protein